MQDFLLLRSAATANTFEEVLYTIDRATGSVDYRSEPSPVQYGDFRRDFVRPNRPEEGIGVIVVQAPAFSQARPNTAELAVIATRYTLASTTPTSFSIPLSDFYQSGVQPSQDPGSQALVACGSDIAFDNRAVTCRLIDLVGDALQQVTIPVNLPVNHLPTVAIYRDRTLTLAGTREAKLFEPTSWLTSIATPGITIPSSLAEPLATIPLQLYPNPAPRSSALTITLPGASSSAASTLRVFDVLGREVLAQPVSAGTKTLQLPLTTLTAGSYQMVIGHARATAIVIE